MVYGSTPYVEMTKNGSHAHLEVHKWHTGNVYVRLVKGLHEPYQALPSASMSNRIVNFAVITVYIAVHSCAATIAM